MTFLPTSPVKGSARKTTRNIREKIRARSFSGVNYELYEGDDLRSTVVKYIERSTTITNVDVDLLSVVHCKDWMYISQAGDSSQRLFMEKKHCTTLVVALEELNEQIVVDFAKKVSAPRRIRLPNDGQMEEDFPLERLEPLLVYTPLEIRIVDCTEDNFRFLAESALDWHDREKLFRKSIYGFLSVSSS